MLRVSTTLPSRGLVQQRVNYFESLKNQAYTPRPFVPDDSFERVSVAKLCRQFEASEASLPAPTAAETTLEKTDQTSRLDRGAKWLWKELKEAIRPYRQVLGWFSSDPIKRAQARDAAVNITGQGARGLRSCLEWSKSIVESVARAATATLGWAAVGLSGLYGIVTASHTTLAIKRLGKLKKVEAQSKQMRPTLQFATDQLTRRAALQASATAAAFLQLSGSAVCLATATMWNPVGWTLIGIGMTITCGWLAWKVGDWLYGKVTGREEAAGSPIEEHAQKLLAATQSEDAATRNDAVAILGALGVLSAKLPAEDLRKNEKRSLQLIAERLHGSEEFFI